MLNLMTTPIPGPTHDRDPQGPVFLHVVMSLKVPSSLGHPSQGDHGQAEHGPPTYRHRPVDRGAPWTWATGTLCRPVERDTPSIVRERIEPGSHGLLGPSPAPFSQLWCPFPRQDATGSQPTCQELRLRLLTRPVRQGREGRPALGGRYRVGERSTPAASAKWVAQACKARPKR